MRNGTVTRRALLALTVGLAASALPIVTAGAAGRPRRRASPPTAKLPLRRVVALDPGHGGSDPGAISPHGLREKDIALATARELARQLDATGRYRAVLTRRRDRFVGLRARIARVRASRPELLLSIHADALRDRTVRGLSVYTLAEGGSGSDRAAATLALRENRDGFIARLHLPRQGRDIAPILLDMARRRTRDLSLALARSIVGELGRAVPLLDKPQRAAGFFVLTAPEIPAALVELGCLSNPVEERLLAQRAYQRRLAQGLARAIDDYFAGRFAA
jgi:N-acetylmuramoyl-L-alanine amidase